MHAEALMFENDLIRRTSHKSAHEEATDAIEAGCALIWKSNRMVLSGSGEWQLSEMQSVLGWRGGGCIRQGTSGIETKSGCGCLQSCGQCEMYTRKWARGSDGWHQKIIQAVVSEKFLKLKYELRQHFDPRVPAFKYRSHPEL
jgi:hypothetical protein